MSVRSSLEAAARVEAKRPAPWEPPRTPDADVEWTPANGSAELAACKAATSVLKRAEAAGWRVDAWYARGPLMGADGDVLQHDVEALTLLFYWRHLEAWAWWINRGTKWELASAWHLRPVTRLGGNDLTHWLCGTEPKTKKEAA